MNAGAIAGPGNIVAAGQEAQQDEVSVQKEAFLKLLVAQMSNQDPLAPQESEQYIQQLTQFSTLEQLMNLNEGVGTLAVGQLSNNSQEALRFVGREVLASGDTVTLGSNGDTSFRYDIQGEPAEVEVSILDEAGNEVYRQTVPADRGGQHSFTWDGRTNDGARAPEGRYRVSVEAKDDEGNPLPVDTWVRGRVTGVRFDSGYPELMIGDRRVTLGDVIEVHSEDGRGASDDPTGQEAQAEEQPGWGERRVRRRDEGEEDNGGAQG